MPSTSTISFQNLLAGRFRLWLKALVLEGIGCQVKSVLFAIGKDGNVDDRRDEVSPIKVPNWSSLRSAGALRFKPRKSARLSERHTDIHVHCGRFLN